MECAQAQELLSARLDRAMNPDDALGLDAHLAGCANCRAAAESLQALDSDLRRLLGHGRTASSRVAERVIAQLRAQPVRSMRWRSIVALGGAVAAGFLLAVLAFRPWNQPRLEQDRLTELAELLSRQQEQQVSELSARLLEEQKARLDQLGKKLQDEQAKQLDRILRDLASRIEQPLVQLALSTGLVEALAPGSEQWRPLGREARVEPGSRVRTSPTARCEFRTADGSEIRLNGDTEVLFLSSRQVEIARGQLWTHVAKDPAPFQVKVPDATVTALGTEFDVLCQAAVVLLTVLEGSTRVQGKETDQVIRAGELARITEGRIAETRQRDVHDLVMATRWVHELLLLKGRGNKELSRRVDDLFARIGDEKTSYLTEEEIRSLGDHGVLPLLRFLQSERSRGAENQFKRKLAGRVLADLSQPWSIPDLIMLLDHDDPEVRYYAAKALTRLTRETQGKSPEQWRDQSREQRRSTVERWNAWWRDNKHRYPGAL